MALTTLLTIIKKYDNDIREYRIEYTLYSLIYVKRICLITT